MPTTTIKYFAYDHLPQHLQAVSAPIGKLAHSLETELPDGPEKSAGMRKLLEAKDCFVRSALEKPAAPPAHPPHVQRVVVEYREHAERLARLRSFIGSDAFNKLEAIDQGLLNEQEEIMTDFNDVLVRRLVRFNVGEI